MSPRISISVRSARLLLEKIGLFGGPAEIRAAQELSAALKPKRSLRLVRARKTAKRKTKSAQTKEIRAALVARSRGHCELCGGPGSEMHHALSRRVPQDISNVLFCCGACHRDITDSRPSAVDVLQAQASKFGELGYQRTVDTLLRRRDFLLARERLGVGAA